MSLNVKTPTIKITRIVKMIQRLLKALILSLHFASYSNNETSCSFNFLTLAIVASKFSKRIVEEVNSNKPISVNVQTKAIDLGIKAMEDIFAYMH